MAEREESRVFVGGLVSQTKAHHLAEAFGRFGTVLEIEIAADRETGRLRGFGFITFTNPDAAHAAIHQMHNTELHGRTITVKLAYPRASSSVEYNYNHGGGGTSGRYRNNSKTSFLPPYDGGYGRHGNNSCFKCGRTGHWARDCTYPRDGEFDNYYSAQHCGPHFPKNQFVGRDYTNPRRHNGGNNASNKCFNCGRTGHWARDCLNQRDSTSHDLRGKRPDLPYFFDFEDDDLLDYDDFTIYCLHCEDFGHSILECPDLGFSSSPHPMFCDCDDEPYFYETFEGFCMQCGGLSLSSPHDNTNNSTREHGESSCGPRFSGKNYGGKQKGYCNGQHRYSPGRADFLNSTEKNSRHYEPKLEPLLEDVPFNAPGQLGNNNGRNPSGGTCFQNSRGRNSRHSDAFEGYDFFEEGASGNHSQQGKHNSKTMPRGAHMGGKSSGRRQNHDHKNDQHDRFAQDEYDREFHEGRGVHSQNTRAQSRPTEPHASSRRPTGGSSRRPQNGARGGNSATRDSRDDGNERRRRGKDPLTVFIFVEKGERS